MARLASSMSSWADAGDDLPTRMPGERRALRKHFWRHPQAMGADLEHGAGRVLRTQPADEKFIAGEPMKPATNRLAGWS